MTDVDPTLNPFGPMVVPQGISTVAVTMIKGGQMPEQLTRDQLLQQRLWAATNDCAAAMKELAAFTDNPPHAADSQEEHVRYIESALQSLRYNCRKLREYKP